MAGFRIINGRVIDPAQQLDAVRDVWVEDGRIVEGPLEAAETVDAAGKIVAPGFFDVRVRLGEPGYEEDETIHSGTAAALAGGFTAVAALPDTDPVVDNRAAAEFVILQAERARHCRVFALGAVTKGVAGEELAEIGQLVEGGSVAFTDGKRAIANAEVMRRALQYTRMFGRPILHHPKVPELAADGVMHDGFVSTVLGLRGIPTAAEEIMVRRDIALAESTGGRIHLMGLSSKASVEEVRQARRRGVSVTADVTPHHLLLTDESLKDFNAAYKVDPPLRPAEHQPALIEGLQDGTIGILSADHQPFAQEKKDRELDLAPFGISGLETLVPLCIRALIEPEHLSWLQLIETLTLGPARLLGTDTGSLELGQAADIVLIDPEQEWVVTPSEFRSNSRNNPFAGQTVRGRVTDVMVDGEFRYRDSATR